MIGNLKQEANVKFFKKEKLDKYGSKIIAKLIVFFLCFIVFFSSKIFGSVLACDYGVFVGLCFLEKNLFALIVSFFISAVVSNVSTWGLVFYAVVCVVSIAISIVFKVKKTLCKTYVVSLVCFGLGLINCLLNVNNLYIFAVGSVLNVVSCVCFYVVYKIISQRRFNLKLQTDELICFGVMICLVFCGLNNLNFFAFDIVKFVGLTLVLFCTFIFPISGTIFISLISGLGASLANGNVGYIVLFSFIAIFNYIFKDYNKILMCITTICVDLCVNLFFDLFSLPIYLTIIPTVCSLVIFLSVSKFQIKKIKSFLFLDENNFGVKEIFENDKVFLTNKLLSVSEVFYEMDKNFRGLLQNKLDEKSSKVMVCNEILRENCENCENRIKCVKNFDREIRNVFQKLTDIGFEKGRITLIDLPAYLTNRCVKVNSVVNSYNVLLNKYKYYSKQRNNLDYSKLLVADQLKGVSNILKSLAQETKKEMVLNVKLQEKIKESLIYSGIVPIEIFCFEKDVKTNVVELVLRSGDFEVEKIKEILNKIYKTKMVLNQVKSLDAGSSVCARFVTAPIFDVSVGISQAQKGGEEVCGDTYASIKLNESKFLFGVCDGMGHGQTANKASETAINIIENFYKAGFDNETILTSVNSLLCMQQSETFSALDVGVIDLKTGEIDFIKQGGTSSYIISKNKIFKIENSGLPLGVLSEVKIKTVKTVLTPEDVVVVISDGVVDSFKSEEDFELVLSKIKIKNPQEIANNILNEANKNVKNYPKDDMTVIVAKLFYY